MLNTDEGNPIAGEVEYGEPYNVGRSKKHINISLRKVEEDD